VNREPVASVGGEGLLSTLDTLNKTSTCSSLIKETCFHWDMCDDGVNLCHRNVIRSLHCMPLISVKVERFVLTDDSYTRPHAINNDLRRHAAKNSVGRPTLSALKTPSSTPQIFSLCFSAYNCRGVDAIIEYQ
jgi:hypothetical protein